MANYITDMRINAYRGIRGLKLENLGNVNIILGDNNCGKTSLLEAVRIISSPHNIDSIAYIARQRDAIAPSFFRSSGFSALLSSLCHINDKYFLDIGADIGGKNIYFRLNGHLEQRIIEPEDMRLSRSLRDRAVSEETSTLVGSIYSSYPKGQLSLLDSDGNAEFAFNKYSRLSRPSKGRLPIQHLSPMDHIALSSSASITRSKMIHDETVEILKLIDPNIVDLRADIDDDTNRRAWIIEDKNAGYIPLSAFGDGTKKIVTLACTIASMDKGILLIDEFETSIHSKAMSSTFNFLLQACAARGIQLFLTTHSEEALDKMLECCSDKLDLLRVVMLEKNHNGSYSRVLDGNQAWSLRVNNNAELR